MPAFEEGGKTLDEQNLKNHTKFVPAFHFFVVPVLLANFISSIFRLREAGFTVAAVIAVLTAMALLVLAFLARIFALKVQDRVIRLEEQLRCARLLPADLQARIPEFTPSQLVALRFAGDAEFPALARKVLDDKLTDRKAIKEMVQNWRPDHLRA
jgi:uncharacterized membrane protein YciS (DUF1049 family)